jgi:hypothetical protein
VAGRGAKDANDYRNGWAIAVRRRLQAMAQSARQQAMAQSARQQAEGADSTALVVVDTAKQQELDRLFGEQSTKKRRVDFSALGHNDGKEARLSTSRPVEHQERKRIGA